MARSQQSLKFGSSSKRKRSTTTKRKSTPRKRKTVKVRSYTRKQGKLPSRDSKGRFKKKRTTRRR